MPACTTLASPAHCSSEAISSPHRLDRERDVVGARLVQRHGGAAVQRASPATGQDCEPVTVADCSRSD